MLLADIIFWRHAALQWVNLATIAHLVWTPANRQLEAAVYALADGPLAAALIVWQSAWVFGSPSHVIRCARRWSRRRCRGLAQELQAPRREGRRA